MNSFILYIPDQGKEAFDQKKGLYQTVGGQPLFTNLIKSLEQDLNLNYLVIVCPEYSKKRVSDWAKNQTIRLPFEVIGLNRPDPVKEALKLLPGEEPEKDLVFFHEADHPSLNNKAFADLASAARTYGAACLVSRDITADASFDANGMLLSAGEAELGYKSTSTCAFTKEKILGIYQEAEGETLLPLQQALKAGIPVKTLVSQTPDMILHGSEDLTEYLAFRQFFYQQNDLADEYYHDRLLSLHTVDDFCRQYGIEYFAISELLQGCVHYGRPIPGDIKSNWHIAMLRKDYEKFVSLLKEHAAEVGLTHNLNSVGRDEKLLWVCRTVMVEDLIYGKGNRIPRDLGKIFISLFDTFPEDKDEVHYLRRTANKYNKKLNKQLKFINAKKVSGIGQIIKRRIKSPFVNKKSAYRIYKKENKLFGRFKGDERCGMAGRLVGGTTRFIPLEELLPLQRLPFGDMMLPCPKDPGTWAASMTPEVADRIHKIQQVDLVILKELDRVCKQIGIGYFLCGGSMLGKVRHDGFIPWDDDIDCGMLRDDYDTFLREAPKYLNTDLFFLQNRATDKMCPYMFSKIRVNGTEYITDYNDGRDFHKGICLDIFPFDIIPTDMKERNEFLREVNQKVKIHNSLCNRQRAGVEHKYPAKGLKERWHRFTFKVVRGFYKMIPLSWTQDAYIKTATRYNDRPLDSETWVASFIPTYTFVQIKNLLPYQRVQFEGVDTYLMHRPDIFLTMQYGDYMQWPPVHKQMGHELIRWKADLPENVEK